MKYLKLYELFLQDQNIIGIIQKGDYYNLDRIRKSLSNIDYIEDDNFIVYKYNEDENQILNTELFVQEVNSVFNLDFLKTTREPIEVGKFNFITFPTTRLNHYMIKSNDSDDIIFGDIKDEEIKRFVNECYSLQKKFNKDNRYIYLTIDQNIVSPGKTLREAGWHLDGLQGDEVSVKKNADYQFIWSDSLPTKFCTQEFDIDELDLSKVNAFKFLGKQVIESRCYLLNPNTIYLMNPYHLHEASQAKTETFRKFVRLSFTQTPITSVKMTINPDMIYNYEIHKTTGNIPKYLK